ncbi:NAD(P)-dependent oxidoreductase [Cyclobacterium jeungdonense]|uniref:NAD(P)-dependent oxidoreductase n=1 Tax=Cyclobacterium jeungdonense TaxID=708087 RepID=A0ABT8C5U2_9BACT|nr:NAD(P)-dependent oxidoreductase [Cyclobacterium jeungdonense]MDN3688106.1 NAD(P)-dependent oxidoreductase [Cyclobacterium jeungdonense]
MKILIIDQMHESIVPLLEDRGHKVDYRPDIDRDGILTVLEDYEGLVIRSKTPINKELLRAAPLLKFVARAGAGLDNIDLNYLEEKGIALYHAAEGNRDAVAEHALGMLLTLFNHYLQSDRQVRKGIWDREGNRGEELAGKTVGIFGYGNMGSAFAQRLRGFDVEILAYDKFKTGFGDKWVKESSFQAIQEKADVLSIHVPLTSETRYFFSPEILSDFRKSIYLINTARGEVIRMDTLNEALQNGKLKGAALDVLEKEKLQTLTAAERLSFEALTQRNNVLFSPHVAGWSHESYRKINQVLVAKIEGEWKG